MGTHCSAERDEATQQQFGKIVADESARSRKMAADNKIVVERPGGRLRSAHGL
ncbi:hypothetical protein [Hydrogenophaga sp. BPS33]|uniref:hypothetical protein n=1 Tax=Hydrogenophaga sp. BPS33 TaxID=2651974 RepID=UPI0019173747|nr:hypothetical protein [Hydrogenophaga sp. BPS33]